MDLTVFVTSNRDRALQLGDFGTYRAQLSRQVSSLRKRLGRATPRNAKYSPKASITSADIGTNHEFARLLLLMAERAWAHAMYIKQQHTQSEGEKALTGTSRSHVLSRLCKAASIARLLVDALGNQETAKATDTDVLEAIAYARTISATQRFEQRVNGREPRGLDKEQKKQKWVACLNELATAHVIYTALLRHTKKEVYKEVLGGPIDAMLKYASWQATGSRNMSLTTVTPSYFPPAEEDTLQRVRKIDPRALESQASQASAGAAETVPTTVTWRSRKANITDGMIGQALAVAASAESRLSTYLTESVGLPRRERAAAYDDVIIASQDTADATRRAIDELEKEGVGESDPRMQDLRVTSLAVNYDMVMWRIGRNRILIGEADGLEMDSDEGGPKKRKRMSNDRPKNEPIGRSLAGLRQRVHLFEEIIQSVDSVKALRGAVRDSGFLDELDAKRAYFQALKCLNIAYSYDLVSDPRKALALLLHATSKLSAAKKLGKEQSQTADANLKLDVSDEQVANVRRRLGALVRRRRGLVELRNSNALADEAARKNLASDLPLIDRLHEYPVGAVDLENLVTYPPKLRPVPVKPIFLDVAWNHIDYPGRAAEVQTRLAAATNGTNDVEMKDEGKAARKGWFGFGR